MGAVRFSKNIKYTFATVHGIISPQTIIFILTTEITGIVRMMKVSVVTMMTMAVVRMTTASVVRMISLRRENKLRRENDKLRRENDESPS
jgi:uncharacterized DUF497 family protein